MLYTVKINVKPHLREYLVSKFGNTDGIVVLPDWLDLYIVIYDLLSKRPVTAPAEQGNLRLSLPHKSYGKRVEIYNYLSAKSVAVIEKRMELMFRSEYLGWMSECKVRHNIDYKASAYMFLERYSVESISVDALLKAHKRMRDRIRAHTVRVYKKTT